jgi:hypothetical protein
MMALKNPARTMSSKVVIKQKYDIFASIDFGGWVLVNIAPFVQPPSVSCVHKKKKEGFYALFFLCNPKHEALPNDLWRKYRDWVAFTKNYFA